MKVIENMVYRIKQKEQTEPIATFDDLKNYAKRCYRPINLDAEDGSEDEPFVCFYEMLEEEQKFVIVWTTNRLLKLYSKQPYLQVCIGVIIELGEGCFL